MSAVKIPGSRNPQRFAICVRTLSGDGRAPKMETKTRLFRISDAKTSLECSQTICPPSPPPRSGRPPEALLVLLCLFEYFALKMQCFHEFHGKGKKHSPRVGKLRIAQCCALETDGGGGEGWGGGASLPENRYLLGVIQRDRVASCGCGLRIKFTRSPVLYLCAKNPHDRFIAYSLYFSVSCRLSVIYF